MHQIYPYKFIYAKQTRMNQFKFNVLKILKLTPQISFLLVKCHVKDQNMSNSFSTILNYSNKFQMIRQSCSSGHLALKTRKSKSQLLKSHISLEKLFEWANMFWMYFKPFKPFRKVLYHNFKLSKWFLCSDFLEIDLTL